MLLDLEAENALAQTLVSVPGAWDYVSGTLLPDMLAGEHTRAIVAAVRSLVARGQPVNPTAVQHELGGRALPRWHDPALVRTATEAGTLARRVRDMWVRRQLQDLGTTLAERAATAPPESLTAHTERVLAGLEDTSQRATTVDVLLRRRLDDLRAAMDSPDTAPRTVFTTGFPDLDDTLGGLRPGRLAVFAARPSQGKSAFAVALADHLARNGIPVGVFWLEDEENDFADRLLARAWELPAETLRTTNRRGLQRVFDAVRDRPERIQTYAHVVLDDTHGLTVQDVQARMRKMHREHGCRVFIADHLGEVQVQRDDRWGARHDLALGTVVRGFRDTAKALQAVPVLCAQMNRAVEQRGARDNAPRMSDLDGSGQIEQAARVVAFLERPVDNEGNSTGEFKVLVVKNTSGATGYVRLRWSVETASVVPL